MEIYEITGFLTGVSEAGVNYLQPADSFQNIINGFINRQVLQSRKGVGFFAPRLAGNTRIFGIFEHTLPNSTKELLAVDQNNLYKYNQGTGVFDLIPFAGSMAGYAGFNIPLNDDYVCGTSYPTAAGAARFVFCGSGITPNAAGSAIFFYNGTDVRDFTSLVDNPNYAAPTTGALTSATYVLWFNERLNFIIPVIASVASNQSILYSGIRNTAGNGDKFNVAGSGEFIADTYQNITGASLLGQVMVINFDRMNFTMEKTRDAFNPYFGRAVPGVLGTDAKFSAVAWSDVIKSLGKTGIISSDGRQTLRTDNKIPNFTADTIDQIDFNLTYGGFDRVNNQFLWAYKTSEFDGSTQNAVLAQNYNEDSWSVYDQRFSVFGQTDLGVNVVWDDIDDATGNTSWAQWDTTEEIWNKIGLGQSVQKTLAGDDLGFIYDINSDYDDYFSAISAIASGSTTTLTIDACGILAGDLITVSGVLGMTEINNFDSLTNTQTGELYNVLSATPTSIVIDVDSTLFTAYSSAGYVQKVIQFSAETIPFNPYRSIGRRCYVSHVEFLLDTNGGDLKVSLFADQQETPFKRDVLLRPTTITQSVEWLSLVVDQESNFITILMKQETPAAQVKINSIRIHCAPGALTSG